MSTIESKPSAVPAGGEAEELDGLDPRDWNSFRARAHKMLDDMIDHVAGVRDQPVWQPIPDEVRSELMRPLTGEPESLVRVHEDFLNHIMPYSVGNLHPGFTAWVHGGGNVFGMLGGMLADGLNANLGGRDHAPVVVERQVVRWACDLLGLPSTASGLLVTGTSIANFIAVLTARTAFDPGMRTDGTGGRPLVAYTSTAVHGCVSRAMDMAGLGSNALRLVAVDDEQRIRVDALASAIASDRAAGRLPFMVIGTAGTVDTGAVDDLAGLAAVAARERLWFHVDGAYGALGMLSAALRPHLRGIEQADSIAFDFHKWGQVPYDAGCILVRDRERQLRAFASDAAYLRREKRGLAAGSPWPTDFGPDLSRGFRALKVWFTLRVVGTRRLGQVIDKTCSLARSLAARIDREPELERVGAVHLNIVCFRFRFASDCDRQNAELAADLQESGVAATSTTNLTTGVVLRCAVFNHRTHQADLDRMVDAVIALGRRRASALEDV